MKVKLKDFEAVAGGIETKKRIMEEGKEEEFDKFIEKLFPNGLEKIELNELLWFGKEWVFRNLGMEYKK